MKNYSSQVTLSEPRFQLTRDAYEKKVDLTRYKHLILSLKTYNIRSGLTYNVVIVRRFMKSSRISHLENDKNDPEVH